LGTKYFIMIKENSSNEKEVSFTKNY